MYNFLVSNYRIIFENLFAYLIENRIIPKEYCSWKIEVDCNCTCYESSDDYPIITLLHYAEGMSKAEDCDFSDDIKYEDWKDLLFMQVSQLYIKLSEY